MNKAHITAITTIVIIAIVAIFIFSDNPEENTSRQTSSPNENQQSEQSQSSDFHILKEDNPFEKGTLNFQIFDDSNNLIIGIYDCIENSPEDSEGNIGMIEFQLCVESYASTVEVFTEEYTDEEVIAFEQARREVTGEPKKVVFSGTCITRCMEEAPAKKQCLIDCFG